MNVMRAKFQFTETHARLEHVVDNAASFRKHTHTQTQTLMSFFSFLSLQVVVSKETDAAAQRSSPDSDQASTRSSDPRPEDKTLQRRSNSSIRSQQVD